MIETAMVTLDATTASIVSTATTTWAALVASIGTIPAILLTGVVIIGAYVSLKWLWRTGCNMWKNRKNCEVNQRIVNG